MSIALSDAVKMSDGDLIQALSQIIYSNALFAEFPSANVYEMKRLIDELEYRSRRGLMEMPDPDELDKQDGEQTKP